MAKVKLTKTDLKKQKDELARFTNYLPTLHIKKKLLQKEMILVQQSVDQLHRKEQELAAKLESWVACFGEEVELEELLQIKDLNLLHENLAGVEIPRLESVNYRIKEYDLYTTPLWVDRGLAALKKRLDIKVQLWIFDKQAEILSAELQVTTQRINLFEKVKIPDAKLHIKKIRNYLEDQETIAIGWALEAKNKILKKELEAGEAL